MMLPEPVPDEPMTSARRPEGLVVHYWRAADPDRPQRKTACCSRDRHELPGGEATTSDWSLVTCPVWAEWTRTLP